MYYYFTICKADKGLLKIHHMTEISTPAYKEQEESILGNANTRGILVEGKCEEIQNALLRGGSKCHQIQNR